MAPSGSNTTGAPAGAASVLVYRNSDVSTSLARTAASATTSAAAAVTAPVRPREHAGTRTRRSSITIADGDEGEDAVDLLELREVVREDLRHAEPEQRETAVAQRADVRGEAEDDRDQPHDAPERAQRDLRRLRLLGRVALQHVHDRQRRRVDERDRRHPSSAVCTSVSGMKRYTRKRSDAHAENRHHCDRQVVHPVDQRVERRLVHERVQGREAEERDGEDERALLAGSRSHPGQDDRLGAPARHERRPVEREGERHPGEPQADRDQQTRDLGAHPLPEAESSEEDVRDGHSEDPRGRAGVCAAIVDERPSRAPP